jgi:hypothetical protein
MIEALKTLKSLPPGTLNNLYDLRSFIEKKPEPVIDISFVSEVFFDMPNIAMKK